MNSSAGGVSLVDMLTPSSLSSVRVNSNFLHVKREFIWHFWHHDHDCGTAMDAAFRFCLRDPLYFMYARFMLQMFIYVSACYLELPRLAPPAYTNVRLEVYLL